MTRLLLIVHIASAAIWLGGNFTQGVLAPHFARADATAAAAWHLGTVKMLRFLYMPAAILILITGILMVAGSTVYGFGTPFVSIGFLVVIVGVVLGMAFFGPLARKAAGFYESGDTAAVRPIESRIAVLGVVDTLLVLLAVVVMVIKLGA